MSYDLMFWRQEKELKLPLETITKELGLEREVDGITPFPIDRTDVRIWVRAV